MTTTCLLLITTCGNLPPLMPFNCWEKLWKIPLLDGAPCTCNSYDFNLCYLSYEKIKHLHLYYRVKFLRIILILEPVKVHVLKDLEFVFELDRLAMSVFYRMKFSLSSVCPTMLES